MDKIIIKLYVPIIEQEFDLKIPKNKKIYNVVNLLVKAIDEMSGGNYKPQNIPTLYDKITAIPYDMNLTVKEANIENSAELVLI